jgi:L-ribulokinase
MTGLKPRTFKPNAKAHEVYRQLYPLYRRLHDSFGTREGGALYDVMKTLLDIRNQVRR